MRFFYTLLFTLLFTTFCFSQELELELVANGFNSPLELKHAGDDRLFVVERGGQIKILDPSTGTINPTPFLNISSIVSTNATERGLLGLAFHPEYQTNGFFYVYYTNLSGNTQVSRFTVSSDPDVADPSSELQMLSFNQPFTNHNGGHIAFGPDGMLYIASGDGGSGGDPQNNSQNTDNLLGTLLRLDVNLPAPHIPADNPFVGTSGSDEIWAFGLRNPWKFSFDSETGNLWIADVGQNAWEEINKEPSTAAGLNYGWRCYEGNNPTTNAAECDIEELTFPIAEYVNTGFGGRCSITGGYVYRGEEYPAIQGFYFFADLCSDEIGTVNEDGDLTFHGTFGASDITSFGVDKDENMYVVAFGGGSVFKLKDNTPLSIEVNDVSTIVMYPNPASENLNLDFGNNVVSEVSIIDLKGNLWNTYKNKNNKSMLLDISYLSSGVYFVKITSAQGENSYQKLIIK